MKLTFKPSFEHRGRSSGKDGLAPSSSRGSLHCCSHPLGAGACRGARTPGAPAACRR
ncbi:hypothetical protein GWL_19420 [Herbaspirillum sp. GW103]|nr:hypothetical protein GWL_19420 [Herbaspirillum sp. GW103]